MLSFLAKVPKLPGESLVVWFKKRNHVGRQLAVKSGLWSLNWARRVLDWDAHVDRSAEWNSIAFRIKNYRGESWLRNKRLAFVSKIPGFGRNRPEKGRLGTRALGGKPQPRWHEGVALAHEMCPNYVNSINPNSLTTPRGSLGTPPGCGKANSSPSLGSRIQEAQSFLASLFNPGS